MTGPLAQQFARLRDLSEEMSLALIELGDEDVHEKHGEICELSSVIERHVQEMERAMWEWLANDGYNDRDCDEIMEQIRRRAALSAGGEGSADRLDDHMAAARHGAALGGHAPRQADEALNALEVLRGVIRFEEDYEGADEAIATVRSELERLREERDSLADAQQFPVETVMSWKRRADSAEAINRYETPLTRASEDAADKELAEAFLRLNPELARRVALLGLARQGEKARAEAAEAENRRLTEGLRQAAECCARPPGVCFDRALLSASPTDGGGA